MTQPQSEARGNTLASPETLCTVDSQGEPMKTVLPDAVVQGIFSRYAEAFAQFGDEEARWQIEGKILTELAVRAGSGRKQILDLACGSGFHSRHLALEGCLVTGIEFAQEAISAGRKLPGGDRVNWLYGDIRVPSGVEADLVLLLGNTLSLFARLEETEEIFVSAASSLAASGYFLIHLLDYVYLATHPVLAEKVMVLDGRRAVFTKRMESRTGGGCISVTLAVEGDTELSETVLLTAWTLPQLSRIAYSSGFSVEASFGGLDGRPYLPGGCRDLVLVLKKH